MARRVQVSLDVAETSPGIAPTRLDGDTSDLTIIARYFTLERRIAAQSAAARQPR
jgi:hypothetical protein